MRWWRAASRSAAAAGLLLAGSAGFAQPPQPPPAGTPPQGQAPPPPTNASAPPAPATSQLWFDPTQLPTFTGTVEGYLPNPRGEIDRLVFREGPQVVFPPDMAEGVRQAAPPGRPITVWGIRARTAPVITMLAYSPNPAEVPPVVTERLYLRSAERSGGQERLVPLAVAGVVRTPYYTPQGEVAGAILEDGTVVVLPAGALPPAPPLRDLLRPGAHLAAEGVGHAGEAGRSLFAERIGGSLESLQPVPAAAPATPAGAEPPQPQR